MQMMTRSMLAVSALCLIAAPLLAEDHAVTFSNQPIWVSGSSHCGGDGNARWLDVDQDGDLDLVTSLPDPRRWAIFRNDNGKLGSKPVWDSKQTTDCDHISVLDFNRDGAADLAATHESHCTLYLNDKKRGDARFGSLPDWETGLYTDANQIDFGDYDSDGDLDMLMASGLPVYCLAIFDNQQGTLSRTISHRIGPRLYSESSIFGDIDSDGDLDIIATYSKEGTTVVYKNDGGSFDEGTEVYRDAAVRHCQRIYCIDINQDAAMELFCAKGPWGPSGQSVALAHQEGSSTMQVVWRSSPDTGFHGFDFRDVDGDGDLDMAAADWSGRSVSVFLQSDGMMSAKPVWIAKTPAPVHEVVFGDVDGDGDLDLAAGGLDQAMVFENQTSKSRDARPFQSKPLVQP
jgi:hypothetical protein